MSEDALRIAVENLFRFGLKWVEEGKLEPPLTMVLVAANGGVVAVRDSLGLPGKAEVVARLSLPNIPSDARGRRSRSI